MNLPLLSNQLGINQRIVQSVITLLEDGATVPFIARYRKEVTNSLDEVQIEAIETGRKQQLALIKRKETILKAIQEQGKLDDKLKTLIGGCWDINQLEDIYLPFKKSRKTRADKAKEQGLEGLAKLISAQRNPDIKSATRQFVKGSVKSVDDALQGARDIIAEWVSENPKSRQMIREMFTKHAQLSSKVVANKKEDAQVYRDYFAYSEKLSKCPSHRLLAVWRGEEEGFLRVSIDVDKERAFERLARYYIKSSGAAADQLELAIKDSLKRLIFPSLANEVKKEAKAKADKEAIKVFASNVRQLLLAPPIGEVAVLALDPGFRTGCKVAVIDANGELLFDTAIYPHPPQKQVAKATDEIKHLIRKYAVKHIAIGNGTAGRESYDFIKSLGLDVEVHLVNENGASIYSASKIARDEFPDKDITVRGAVSIGRRLKDPLAELVKIDPKSIGVGQYQHDVNQVLLKEELEKVVSSCVNAVGINLNTASPHVLQFVSGLGPKLAENIVNYRKDIGRFESRVQLKKVPRMGAKAFEQAAGFLRVRDGKNVLDNTGIHPERYAVVKQLLKKENITIEKAKSYKPDLKQYVSEAVGLPTLQDIWKELQKPGLDPRGEAVATEFSADIRSMTDLSEGMVLSAVVTNLTKFGAFVDLGIKEAALLHISEIVDKYISDPSEVLHLNQQIEVKVLSIDVDRKRVGVSMKAVDR